MTMTAEKYQKSMTAHSQSQTLNKDKDSRQNHHPVVLPLSKADHTFLCSLSHTLISEQADFPISGRKKPTSFIPILTQHIPT